MPVPFLVSSRAIVPLKNRKETQMSNTAKKENLTTTKPVDRLNMGLIKATIWERKTDEYTFYSVSFEKRYRDSEGNWHSTHTYDSNDLLLLAKLANNAHTEIANLRRHSI
jgi:hypothetical protein